MFKKEDLYKLYWEEEKTLQEIGDIYGCDRNNVKYHMKKHNIPFRTRKQAMKKYKKVNVTAEEIKAMVDSGMLLQDIAKKYNCSRSTLNTITRAAGMNFTNNANARQRQSEFMRENNPYYDEETKRKAIQSTLIKTEERMIEHRKQYQIFDNSMSFKQYAKRARAIAYHHYKKGELIPSGQVIDHMYSISDGYKNQVPIMIISNPNNLRLITKNENLKKSSKSIITLKELYKGMVFND